MTSEQQQYRAKFESKTARSAFKEQINPRLDMCQKSYELIECTFRGRRVLSLSHCLSWNRALLLCSPTHPPLPSKLHCLFSPLLFAAAMAAAGVRVWEKEMDSSQKTERKRGFHPKKNEKGSLAKEPLRLSHLEDCNLHQAWLDLSCRSKSSWP